MAEMRRLLMPGKPRNGTVWNSGCRTQGTKIVRGRDVAMSRFRASDESHRPRCSLVSKCSTTV